MDTQWKLPNILLDPSQNRYDKPREQGITMVIDKGLGVTHFQEMLLQSSAYIDFIKFGFGTALLYPDEVIQKKISMAKEYDVQVYPGGTLTEIAIATHSIAEYFQYIRKAGFSCIEISDGSIDISSEQRLFLIDQAIKENLLVITECGKKEIGSTIDFIELEERLSFDLKAGASYVIVEGRESGTGVGIFDSNGNFDKENVMSHVQRLSYSKQLIWEAPQKKQQTELIQLFGTNVNLGNISPNEVISLEALRRGLRSDTFIHLGYQMR